MSFFSIPGASKTETKKERVITKYTPSKPIVKPFQSSSSIARHRPSSISASPRSSITPESSGSPSSPRSSTKRSEAKIKPRRPRERELQDEARVTKKRKRVKAESETESESDAHEEGQRSPMKRSRTATSDWEEASTPRLSLAERDLFDMGRSDSDKADWEGFVHSAEIVKQSNTRYVAYFDQPGFEAVDFPEVKLLYPRRSCYERFSLLVPRVSGEYFPINDLLRAIQLMISIYVPPSHATTFGVSTPDVMCAEDQEEAAPAGEDTILRALHKAFNRKDGPAFIAAVDNFNASFERILLNDEAVPHVDEDSWVALVTGIGEQVYQRQVGPATASLSEYEPFSDNVYGELLPRFMTEILTRFPMNADSLFLDLGSGVSNLTIQASLQASCQSLGCEQMPNPARMAVSQIEEAKRRWSMWCVRGNAECKAVEGDFCANDEVRRALPKADLVLVNNYAFTPSLNDRLSLLFLDLKDGARIISLKPFLPKDFRLTERTATSPLAILKMRQLNYPSNSVSWTENGGVYYECVIDRTAIREFFEKGIRRGR